MKKDKVKTPRQVWIETPDASKEEVREKMIRHIRTLRRHYEGEIAELNEGIKHCDEKLKSLEE